MYLVVSPQLSNKTLNHSENLAKILIQHNLIKNFLMILIICESGATAYRMLDCQRKIFKKYANKSPLGCYSSQFQKDDSLDLSSPHRKGKGNLTDPALRARRKKK
jgi:hypothetical protein